MQEPPEIPYKMKDQMNWAYHLDTLVLSLHKQLTQSGEAESQVRGLRTLFLFLKPHWDGNFALQIGADKKDFQKLETHIAKVTGFDEEAIKKFLRAMETYRPSTVIEWTGVDDDIIFERYEAILDLIERKGLGGTKRSPTMIQ